MNLIFKIKISDKGFILKFIKSIGSFLTLLVKCLYEFIAVGGDTRQQT